MFIFGFKNQETDGRDEIGAFGAFNLLQPFFQRSVMRVSSGPRRGTRPRCPGRRRDERSSFSSPGAPEDFIRKCQRVLVAFILFFSCSCGGSRSSDPPPPSSKSTTQKLLLHSFFLFFFFLLETFFGAEFFFEDAAEEWDWTRYWIGYSIFVRRDGFNCLFLKSFQPCAIRFNVNKRRSH